MEKPFATMILLAIVVLGVVSTMFGLVQAESSNIIQIGISDKVDKDCDGYASEFLLMVEADTECHGCNDESSDSPEIEPFLDISITDPNGRNNKFTTATLRRDSNYKYEQWLPSDFFEVSSAGDIEIVAKLKDEDPALTDRLDESKALTVAAEPSSEDPASKPKAKFTVPNSMIDRFLFFFQSNDRIINESIRFDASDSSYSGCAISSYKWDFDDDGIYETRGKKAAHTFTEPGTKDISLTVANQRGSTDIYTKEIIIYKDTDSDGITNKKERSRGTDPNNVDSDRDLVDDNIDPMPAFSFIPIGIFQVFVGFFGYLIILYGINISNMVA